MSNKKTRRVFDDAFKINTVKAWRASGKSAPDFAREYDIEANYLYTWAQKYESGGQITSPDAYAELKRLRKENKELREEAEILKKAMGYFAGRK